MHILFIMNVTRLQCLADLMTTGAMSKGHAYTKGDLSNK